MPTNRVQLSQKTSSSGTLSVFHIESDTRAVKIGDTSQTLEDYLTDLESRRRTVTLSGDVTGTATEDSEGEITISAEVANDSHKHSGSTVELTTASRAVVTSDSKGLVVSSVTASELGYLSGVTGAIQPQLDGKAAGDHNHDSVYVKSSLIGAANGIAPLGSDGIISAVYLPSFVDDIIEGSVSSDFGSFTKTGDSSPLTPEAGKIYVDVSSGKMYRWSGSAYVVVSDTITLGETSSTAYRGDRGKIAYDHSQATHARTDATAVGSSDNGYITINGTKTAVYTHPTTAGNKHIPSAGASGNYLKWSSSGTASWATPTLSDINEADDIRAIEALSGTSGFLKKTAANTWTLDTSSYLTAHPTVTTSTDTTSTASPAHGSTFTAIDSVTRDGNGHVTKVNTKTITLPADNNTDTKVNVSARGTTKAYLLADTTAPTSTAAAHTAVAETSVYLDTTAGKLVASSFAGNGAGITNLNMGNAASGTLAVGRGGTGGTTAAGARSSLGAVNLAYGGTTAPTNQNVGDIWLEAIS